MFKTLHLNQRHFIQVQMSFNPIKLIARSYSWHRDTLQRYVLQGALLQGISCKEAFWQRVILAKKHFGKLAFWQIHFLQTSISQGEIWQMGIFANK